MNKPQITSDMREIKFRLWSKVAQCIIDWEEVKQKPHTIFDDSNWIPMQFTGLKDKNGTEIYEGDIVTDGSLTYKIGWNAQNTCFWIGADATNDADWCINCLSSQPLGNGYYSRKDLEIIGNIHE